LYWASENNNYPAWLAGDPKTYNTAQISGKHNTCSTWLASNPKN